MCRKSIKMMKFCGKMPSILRLEKIGVSQSMKGQFTLKYFILGKFGKFPVFSMGFF